MRGLVLGVAGVENSCPVQTPWITVLKVERVRNSLENVQINMEVKFRKKKEENVLEVKLGVQRVSEKNITC